MTACKSNWKHISAQKMVSFYNCCDAACLKFKFRCDKRTGYLRTIHFLEGNASSIRCMNSTFHKIQWQHFSGVVDKFKNAKCRISSGFCVPKFFCIGLFLMQLFKK